MYYICATIILEKIFLYNIYYSNHHNCLFNNVLFSYYDLRQIYLTYIRYIRLSYDTNFINFIENRRDVIAIFILKALMPTTFSSPGLNRK